MTFSHSEHNVNNPGPSGLGCGSNPGAVAPPHVVVGGGVLDRTETRNGESMTDKYREIIGRREMYAPSVGFDCDVDDEWLFPFQRHAVRFALAGGRRALFLDTGLGKSRMQLAWADRVCRETGGRVLILAPLAVGPQTVKEAARVGLDGVVFSRTLEGTTDARIVVTNYDSLAHFDASAFAGVVLDESSILKSFTGSTKVALCDAFARTPYRLCCTATPAPNDHLELGNHAEFLGILSSHQMIARWFITDQSQMGTYRLKGHAVRSFWDWVSSWAACAGLPSDLGAYADDGYVLPPLNLIQRIVTVDIIDGREDGALFRAADLSATSVHKEKRRTAAARAAEVAALIAAEPDEAWLVWCETDYEAVELMAQIPGAVEVAGSMKPDAKSSRLLAFADTGGVLVTKPKIAGFGMNWQNCARVVFAGGSYSYEALYQAVRRAWRFGQTRPVDCYIVMAATEQHLWSVVSRKSDDHESMKREMFAASRRAQSRTSAMREYHPNHIAAVPPWLFNRQ